MVYLNMKAQLVYRERLFISEDTVCEKVIWRLPMERVPMGKKIEINIGSLEDSGKRFIAAWHGAEKSDTPQEFLTFKDFETLLKILTPKRLSLLKYLRNAGSMSIRSLALQLERDYSNVHNDVKQLINCGLIEKDSSDKISVPWSEIIAHFSLGKMPKKPPPKKHTSLKSQTLKYHKKAS